MTDAERLQNLRECYGPDAWRVGDPPTDEDVELLLRLLADAEQRAATLRELNAKLVADASAMLAPSKERLEGRLDTQQRIAEWLRGEARKLDALLETAHSTPNAYAAMQVERTAAINFADAIVSGAWREEASDETSRQR